MRASGARTAAGAAAWGLLAGAALLLALRPLSLAFPSGGLDGSWIVVLGEAATRPARWGVDLAFTYGPASALVTRYFTAGYLGAAVPVVVAVALAGAGATLRLARIGAAGRRSGPALVAAAAAATAAGLAAELQQDQDGFVFALALALFLLDLGRGPRDRASRLVVAAGAALFGVLALAKTSFGVVGLGLFVLADARATLAERRRPLAVPAVLGGFLAAFLLCGQRLGDLPAYLALQGQVAAGYGQAMYLAPARGEVAAFLACGAALVAVAGACGGPGRGGRLVAPLGTAFVVAIAFKAGFIRADTHSQIAWSALGLGGLAMAAGPALRRSVAGAGALALASLALLWLAAPLLLLADTDRGAAPGQLPGLYREMGEAFATEAEAWGRLLASPARFAADARAAKAAAWTRLRAAEPLPPLTGGVDILPSDQGAVLAAGLDYRPRPSFQEYSTYTAGLIAANLAFVAGPDAPDWVLWGPGGLDDRYPATTEGELWPELLRRYEPVRRVGDLLALHRRAVPLPDVLGPAEVRTLPFGERLPVAGPGPVFARVTVRETILGRIAAALFRPPALVMKVAHADGAEAEYRFIPALGAGGFLLSPDVSDAAAFANLGFGTGDGGDRLAVTGLVVGGSPLARFFYDTTASVELRPVTLAPQRPSPEARDLFDALARGRPWRQTVRGLARAAALGGDHLSVPAPGAVTVPVRGGRRLRLAFGIEDGAWTDGRTEGVCFAVKSRPDAPAPLWERCLDPRAVPGDRGPQTAEVELPPGTETVTAETRCRASCAWGWSYWSGIAPGD